MAGPEHDDTRPELPEPARRRLDELLAAEWMWEEPDDALEERVLELIGRGSEQPTVTSEHRRSPWWVAPVAGVAALVLLVAGVLILDSSSTEDGTDGQLALAGTELAPGAVGVASVTDTPMGTRLVLDLEGLPPAPAGTYYEAWLRRDAEAGVSAGTFHLRGGQGPVYLWAGVSAAEYPVVTVTIQKEADPLPSGRAVLRGRLGAE